MRCCAIDFPVERQPALLDLMAPVVADAADYFIGCDVSPCVFEMYWRLRGMEDALTGHGRRSGPGRRDVPALR